MELKLEKIVIVKKGLTGEVSVKYNLFSINKIAIDMNSAVDTFKVAKYENSPIVNGQLIEQLKEQVLDLFQEVLGDAPDGIYEVTTEEEYVVNKL